MSRILFAGDPHGPLNLHAIARFAAERRPDALVLLGDMEVGAPLDVEMAAALDAGVAVAWIFGNHDGEHGFEVWSDLTDPVANPRTAGGALHGRVLEIAGMRIAGLGGVFRESVWHPRERDGEPRVRSYAELARRNERLWPRVWEGKTAAQISSIFPETYERLSAMKADVLVAHEAPSSHRLGFRVIDELASAVGARLIVHGHHHEDYHVVAPDAGLEVVGVGLASIVDETGALLVDSGSNATRSPRLADDVRWRRVR
jgi:predicted phosphodiesterase